MKIEVEVVLSCKECNMEVRRREKDLEDPKVMSTDSLVSTHMRERGHLAYSLHIEIVPSFKVRIVEVFA